LGPKTCNFGPLQTLIGNISGTRQHIQNGKDVRTREIPPAFNEKSPVNFGSLTAWNIICELSSGHFSGYYISALHIGVLRPEIFTRARYLSKAIPRHTPTVTGSPKNFNRENLKFGFKFSVCTSITSGLIGISSQIFIQTTCREAGVITWVQFLDDLHSKIWEGEETIFQGH